MDAAGGDGEGDRDDPPLIKSAKFNLDVSSSIAPTEQPLVVCALRNAEDTVITFLASSKLIPSDSIV